MCWCYSTFNCETELPQCRDGQHGTGPAVATGSLRGSRPVDRSGLACGRTHRSQRLRFQRPLCTLLQRLLEDGKQCRGDRAAGRRLSSCGTAMGPTGSVSVRHICGYFHGAVWRSPGLEVPLLSARTTWRVSPVTDTHLESADLILFRFLYHSRGTVKFNNYSINRPVCNIIA